MNINTILFCISPIEQLINKFYIKTNI